MVMLSARSRDPRFMASFILTGGCVIVRKIFGGHKGDKGFHEMYVVGESHDRDSASLKFRETVILSRSILLAYFHKKLLEEILFVF